MGLFCPTAQLNSGWMHTDARKVDNGSLIEGDLCIVGAGPAGISMALDWMDSSHRVILLEGGGFEYEDQMQELYAGKTTGQRYFPLRSVRLHYFGGTSGHWAGYCSPLDPIDFSRREWIEGSGWPISRQDLDPYYRKAQAVLDLDPFDYDVSSWQRKNPTWNPLPFDESQIRNKIWQFSPPTRFGTRYRERILDSRPIHLYTYANAAEIVANESVREIREIRTKNLAGKELRVRAKHYVLACCAIQNARLLLASHNQAAGGLGNGHDLVGRYFMEHVETNSAELWLAKPDSLDMYMVDYGKSKARAELAIGAAFQQEQRILNGTCSLSPLEVARSHKPFIETWNEDDKEAEKKMRLGLLRGRISSRTASGSGRYEGFQVFTRLEQAPRAYNRVTLDTERDALGMPRANLHWELTALEKHSIRTIAGLIGKECGRSGVGRIRLMEYLRDPKDSSWPSFTGAGWHHMGTTRMSTDPAQGVVDANCRVHGISNLFVAGSSCYVTAGAPNPTLTLVALSLRLSDHLKSKMAGRA